MAEIKIKPGRIVITGAASSPERITNAKGLIRHIIWSESTTSDVVRLGDLDGDYIWTAQGINGVQFHFSERNLNISFNGLDLLIMDGGVLILHVDQMQPLG